MGYSCHLEIIKLTLAKRVRKKVVFRGGKNKPGAHKSRPVGQKNWPTHPIAERRLRPSSTFLKTTTTVLKLSETGDVTPAQNTAHEEHPSRLSRTPSPTFSVSVCCQSKLVQAPALQGLSFFFFVERHWHWTGRKYVQCKCPWPCAFAVTTTTEMLWRTTNCYFSCRALQEYLYTGGGDLFFFFFFFFWWQVERRRRRRRRRRRVLHLAGADHWSRSSRFAGVLRETPGSDAAELPDVVLVLRKRFFRIDDLDGHSGTYFSLRVSTLSFPCFTQG